MTSELEVSEIAKTWPARASALVVHTFMDVAVFFYDAYISFKSPSFWRPFSCTIHNMKYL